MAALSGGSGTSTSTDAYSISSDCDSESETFSDSGTSTRSNDPKVISLLSRLKAPNKSDLGRKMRIQHPPKGKKNPLDSIAINLNTVKNHVFSTKHKESNDKFQKGSTRDGDIVKALQKHDNQANPVGQTLPKDVRLYRIKVVMTLLKAGIPLAKIDTLRDLLEEKATRLTDTRHMYDLIPFVLDMEKDEIRSEIKDKNVSIVFDGTRRLGEVLAVIIRYFDDWEVKQRLVRVEMLTKSMSGDELARELIEILSVSFSIRSQLNMASMRDGANLAGEKFHLPYLVEFSTLWISLFSQSPKTKALWKEQTGRAMPSLSKTRWWSRWEIYKQLLVQFGDVKPFLEKNSDIGSSLKPKLLKFMTDPSTLQYLKIELASAIDAGEVFVSTTYRLEGDSLLVLEYYEDIEKIRAAIRSKHYPNLSAISQVISGGNSIVAKQWIEYGMACIQPGIYV
uniref:DUF4371 domain-containing protein n=1 Tax=Amphimedon queenslandica TaxID=400682 RepID=A0A1X7V442_AMPQE